MSADESPIRERRFLIAGSVLVLCLAAVIYFIGLNGYPLLDPDEGRYAEIPREMLESGDFITPRLNYVKYFEKPRLFYWCVAGAMRLLGQEEWAVRTVPALAGFLAVVLIMAFGNRLFGRRVGVMAGWVYLTSVIPLILARLPIIDGLFSLLLTATWMAWWEGYTAPTGTVKKRWYMVAWACMGLAVMTKGIAAIALTGLIIFAFVAARRDWRAFGAMAWVPGLLIFLAIVLPWHLVAGFRNPEFFHFYVVVQHFGRLVSEEHARPAWYFLIIFPFGMLFWTAFFFPAALAALKKAGRAIRMPWIRSRKQKAGKADPAKDTGKTEEVLYLVIWAGAVIGLFSLSRSKLVPYILPAYPAMALLTAYYLVNGALKRTSARWCAGITAILLLALIPVASYYVGGQEMLPADELARPVRIAQGALLLGSILLTVAVFKRGLIPAAVGLAMVLLIPSMVMTVPVAANHRKVGGLLKGMPRPLPEEIRIAEWRTFDQGLGFYSRRRTILVDNIGELRFGSTLGDHGDYFLKGAENLKRLAGEGPLLVNLRPGDWPEVRDWGMFRLAAANSTNVMVGNEAFFRVAGLIPWPDDAVTPPPLLLMPRPVLERKG
ncbi:MAG: glycosyltransferase family 39 protein [Deltaproteobacteria bacterium]|nr:glycosyltransferase family 39 protein [Deltaproteobacteria bacterium]